jgi:hypothetical protein
MSNSEDSSFEIWAIDHMREMESKWKQRGDCFSWIDSEPTFWCVADWYLMNPSNGGDLVEIPNPKLQCRRIMRFSMLGGGQIRTTEHFKATPSHWLTLLESPTCSARNIDLKITAHNGESIVTAFGEKYRGNGGEMNAEAVVLRGERQSIADRTAATFRLIDTIADNFFALLDGTEGCAICGKPLRDEISKLLGVGPDCARKYSVPHSRQAAEKRLLLRRKLLTNL